MELYQTRVTTVFIDNGVHKKIYSLRTFKYNFIKKKNHHRV